MSDEDLMMMMMTTMMMMEVWRARNPSATLCDVQEGMMIMTLIMFFVCITAGISTFF